MANETMVLLEKIVVPSGGAASIDFTNIPQSYTDLVVMLSARVDAANGVAQIYFNNSTASDKLWRRLYGDGSSVVSDSSNGTSSYVRPIGINRSDQTASTFGNMSIYIPNYTSSTTYKSVSVDGVNENNATFAEAAFAAGLWQSNSAITRVTIIPSSGNFVQYTTAYLYGVAKQGVTPTNAPAATGGDSIVFDGTYWIHTFYSSGTFTPKKALTCDYLVVAGGGGGGGTGSSGGGSTGGGAGGYRCSVTGESSGGGAANESKFSAGTTAYTVTIGAGGGGGTAAAAGGNGSNSVFASITSTGGGGASAYNVGDGQSGGSGGGSQTATNTTASGTTGQGYAGGGGTATSTTHGGGGGAGSVGLNSLGNGSNRSGNGVSSSITGTAVSRAGGGNPYGSTGNVSGGGNGDTSAGANNATNGTVNTGGGGGGRWDTSAVTGRNGGSGIVIVRYAA
jgi:hypothetical protein